MKKLVLLIALACALVGVSLAIDQAGAGRAHRTAFKPHVGQTVLELTVEKRGEIFIDLLTKDAPKATAQIISLARAGFYNGQTFYKVLKSPRPYLVQTGDPLSKTEPPDSDKLGDGGSGTKIPYEDTHQEYFEGRVVLATDNGDPNTGDSQFYILLGDYDNLLKGTGTVFGRVVLGMNVVNKIELGDRIVTATILTG